MCNSVIGLGLRDARFHTLHWKNAHYFQEKCANSASIISRMVNKKEFCIIMAKIALIITQKCAFFHINNLSDIITGNYTKSFDIMDNHSNKVAIPTLHSVLLPECIILVSPLYLYPL